MKLSLSPEEAVSLELWSGLTSASKAVEQGQFVSALSTYNDLMPNIMSDDQPKWLNICTDTAQPSLNGMCLYLSGYYTFTHTWQGWNHISRPIFDHSKLKSLSLCERLSLLAIRGWATIRRRSLVEIIQEQEEALELARSSHQLSMEAGHHHLMLCYAYTLAFEEEKSLEHGQEAQYMFEECGSKYGVLRAFEMLGTAYYTAWKYDEALSCYDQLEKLIHQIGSEAFPMLPFYGRGWSFLGLEQFEDALQCFRMGEIKKTQYGLLYDAARCVYAEGYTLFRQRDFEGALQRHHKALGVFCDDDHYSLNMYNFNQGSRSIPMMATCLHNIALIYEYQRRFYAAFREEERAVNWQRQLDDPGQSADFLRRAIYLSFRCGYWSKTLSYLSEYIRLRLKYKVPNLHY